MHHSRLCALLIDCNTSDIDRAARFWADALGRPVDPDHPGTRGNYRMLETPPDEPIVQIQKVDHESRVHIDIETDDIPAEVARLEALGATVVDRLERWVVMQAPTGSGSAWCGFNGLGFRRTRRRGIKHGRANRFDISLRANRGQSSLSLYKSRRAALTPFYVVRLLDRAALVSCKQNPTESVESRRGTKAFPACAHGPGTPR